MNKQQLLAAMEECGMHAGKILGQNFLLDSNLLDFIIRSTTPQPGETILEVGPGFGALTQLLLNTGAEVYSIEFDHRLAEYLRSHLPVPNFHLIEGDAARVNLVRELPIVSGPWRAIANLPYSISSIFIVRLLELINPPREMFFMLQKEMGQRLAATISTKNYGALSVRAQYLYQVELVKIVPPQVFFPPPGVDSALVSFRLRDEIPPWEQRRKFNSIVKVAFAQRRKQLFKVLAGNFPPASLEQAFEKLGIPREIRPEALTVSQFAQLAAMVDYEEK